MLPDATDNQQAGGWRNEQGVLSLCLTDETVIHELTSYGLSADHFHEPGHRAIFRAMLDDLRSGIAPDEAALLDRHAPNVGLRSPWKDLSSLGIQLEGLASSRPRRANLRGYCEKILDSARRRGLVAACRRVVAMGTDGVATDDIVAEVQSAALRAHEMGAGAIDLPTMETIARDACDRAVAVARGEQEDTVVSLGLRDLDGKFRARRGDYVLIGARPSMGKTHFLLSIAEQVARTSGPFLLCSVEMRDRAIGDRIYAHDAAGQWDDDPEAAVYSSTLVMRRWEGLPIRVDTSSRSLGQIASALRIAKQRHGIVAAAIDYLQLLRLPKGTSREQEVASASRELAALANELDIVLFVACQLNRQLESRPLRDRRPRMSDLRESGQLEQDADGILFLFREAAYNQGCSQPELLEVGIAKQRNGRAPRTAFCLYEPGDGYVRNLSAGEEMRASASKAHL